jgi:hypothetical protein
VTVCVNDCDLLSGCDNMGIPNDEDSECDCEEDNVNDGETAV